MAAGLVVSLFFYDISETFDNSHFFFHLQLTSFSIKINGVKSHYWPLEIYLRRYWWQTQHTWVRFLPSSCFFVCCQKNLFSRLIFFAEKWQKVFISKEKKGHLFAASFVIVDSKPSLAREEWERKKEEKPLSFLMVWEF